MNEIIGKGSYGSVFRGEHAKKKLTKLSHLIQEVVALKCFYEQRHVVKCIKYDLEDTSLYMELYDSDLRREMATLNLSQKNKVASDCLKGLIEIHDLGLMHGDIKPNNILIRLKPFCAVIGDCGFVSIPKYCKVKNGNWMYRGKNPQNDKKHDIYSLGVIFLELFAGFRISMSGATKDNLETYPDLPKISRELLPNSPIIAKMVSENISERPTAKEVYEIMYSESVYTSISSKFIISAYSDQKYRGKKNQYRHLYKKVQKNKGIGRAKICYDAFVEYTERKEIRKSYKPYYFIASVMIATAMFSKSSFNELKDFCPQGCFNNFEMNEEVLYKCLGYMIEDEIHRDFIMGI